MMSLCTKAIFPFASPTFVPKSTSVPSMVPRVDAVNGAAAIRKGNFAGEMQLAVAARDRQYAGNVYVSTRTASAPASRKFCAAHSTARALSGEPLTRPPMWSHSWRRSVIRPCALTIAGKRQRATHVIPSAVEREESGRRTAPTLRLRLLQLRQIREHLFAVLGRFHFHIHLADDALRIDEERVARGVGLTVVLHRRAVLRRHGLLGVGEQLEVQRFLLAELLVRLGT